MDKVECTINKIVYQNAENGYSVISVKGNGNKNLFEKNFTITGIFANVGVGTVLTAYGKWVSHKKYGTQFEVERWEEVLPVTVSGIEKYLSSGIIQGIGSCTAKLIVEHFGKKTLEILDSDPKKLMEVHGIGKKRMQTIIKGWESQREIKNIMMFLKENNVGTSLAMKIYKKYGDSSISKIKENPYRLAEDLWGVGFKTADAVAQNMGFSNDNPFRIQSGLKYILNELASDGHTCYDQEELITEAFKILQTDERNIREQIAEQLKKKELIKYEESIYLPIYYNSEKGVANNFKRLLSVRTDSKSLKVNFDKMFSKTGIEYDDIQKDAISRCANSKVMILTGGPGTGKTTTTLGIITVFKNMGLRVLLAAPTGRASKRLSEATNMNAKTIHRLLEYSPDGGYKRDKSNPLEGDALIVDEASMIDTMLMASLMKAVPDNMRVVFVGDVNQLPSVGAGNVLKDMIACGKFDVVELKTIFRQAQTSHIVMNAHKINNGKTPYLVDSKIVGNDIVMENDTDFIFIEEAESEDVASDIVQVVKQVLPAKYDINPLDIQVLTPMQKGAIGAQNLNALLQEALNSNTAYLKKGFRTYKKGDKVMQIRNNYDKGVFNGDIGIIERIELEDKTLVVNFNDVLISYEEDDIDELVLAYAVTIHKSQGSEYPIVVMPVHYAHYIMLQRNLIYTGITRAKKIIVLIGTKKALAYSVKNLTVDMRETNLVKMICSSKASKSKSEEPSVKQPEFDFNAKKDYVKINYVSTTTTGAFDYDDDDVPF